MTKKEKLVVLRGSEAVCLVVYCCFLFLLIFVRRCIVRICGRVRFPLIAMMPDALARLILTVGIEKANCPIYPS